jgi:hypothetical protein
MLSRRDLKAAVLAPTAKKLLYARVLWMIVRVRLILWVYGFETVRKLALPKKILNQSFSASEIALAIQRTSRFVPRASCLTQAAAGHLVLAGYGLTSSIRVGVKIDRQKQFMAHAWLLFQEKVILGGDDRSVSEYQVLKDFKAFSVE